MGLSDQIVTPGQVVGVGGNGGGGGGYSPSGNTSQILLGDGSASGSLPAAVGVPLDQIDGGSSSGVWKGNGAGGVESLDAAGVRTFADVPSNADLTSGLAGKANTSHTHAISDTTGLQTALDAKASASDVATNTTNIAANAAAIAANTTAIASKADATQTISAKTADYTLVAADVRKLVTMDHTSDRTFTVNSSLGLSAGQRIDLARLNTGEVTIAASGVTINSPSGLRLRARYSVASLLCTGSNTYLLVGDLKT